MNFTPDGCMVEKYITDKFDNTDGGKNIAMIKFLVLPLAYNMIEFEEKNKYFLI